MLHLSRSESFLRPDIQITMDTGIKLNLSIQ